MTNVWIDFLIGLLTNFVFQVLAVLFAIYFWDRYVNKWFYDGSTVSVVRGDTIILSARSIGWRKSKDIADDDSDLSVFLKGVVSPYEWINCDIVSDGRKSGMLVEKKERQKYFGERYDYIIDLAKNPPKEQQEKTCPDLGDKELSE